MVKEYDETELGTKPLLTRLLGTVMGVAGMRWVFAIWTVKAVKTDLGFCVPKCCATLLVLVRLPRLLAA